MPVSKHGGLFGDGFCNMIDKWVYTLDEADGESYPVRRVPCAVCRVPCDPAVIAMLSGKLRCTVRLISCAAPRENNRPPAPTCVCSETRLTRDVRSNQYR